MKPKLFIRTDGSTKIGLGHLVRCIALAHMLKKDFDTTFVCRDIPDTIIEELQNGGFRFRKVEREKEFFGQLTHYTIAVLDGYQFDSDYQKHIKAIGAKLVCIDDLHDKEFFADLIINHAPGITPQDYKAQPYTQFALGLDYALLRPAFLEQANKQRTIEKVENVLICFGGSDPQNLTQSTLIIALEFQQLKKIIVVTGLAYYTTDSFKQLVASDIRIDHRNSLNEQQMFDTMLESDLAIVPASGVLFEALAVGCVVITGSYINNQDYILKGFSNLNTVEICENLSTPRNALLNAINGKHPYRKSSIDGGSTNRIKNKIKALLN